MSEPANTSPTASPTDAPYIRTYARDLASLGGDTATPSTAQKSAASPLPSAPQSAAPPMPSADVPPPRVVQADVPPAYIIPDAPSTNESREAVLERLRTKARTIQPEAPTPAPIIPKAPSTNEDRQTILDRLHSRQGIETPKRQSEVLTQERSRIASDTSKPSPLHTYTSDFQDTAKGSGASPLSVLAAEQDAHGTPDPEVLKEKSNLVPMLVGGSALIIVGVVSVFIAFQVIHNKPVVPTELFVPSLIFADERVRISGSGEQLQKELLALRDRPMHTGEVTIAYITYATTTAKGETIEQSATGGALIAALGLPAPELVLRNVLPESTVGVIRAEEETRPFFILRVSSYERTFAGMLSWENTIATDLAFLFPPFTHPVTAPVPVVDVSATTTATTTQSVGTSTPGDLAPAPRAPFVARFEDEVIENHDVRILRDETGNSVLLYGYKDRQTLLLARNESAFKELLTRLSTAKTQ